MSKFVKITNPLTGKTEYQFPAKLVSINTASPQKYTNASGVENEYYLATVNFVNASGVAKTGVTAQVFKKSLDYGMPIGAEYLSTVSQGDDGKVYIRTSHLPTGGSNATAEDFGLEFETAAAPVMNEA
jgi:hypothetical protein